ncbi:MAG: hypothetical protein ACP5QG_03410 [candidate division WOR-3 bacterium]
MVEMNCCDMPENPGSSCCDPYTGIGRFRCLILGYVARNYMKRKEAERLFGALWDEIEALREQIEKLKERQK